MLEIKNVTKIYGSGDTKIVALDKVSFHVNKGDFIAIMGPSGSGKSTLLNVIGGLDRLSAGRVILDGQRIDNLSEEALVDVRRRKMSYVFQQYHLLSSLTALENVMLPAVLSNRKAKNGKALQILRLVGLEKRAQQRPNQLSGGEQQRVAIARALINNPLITLADEPTGNLDQKTGREILDLLKRVNEQGCTIIMVTHNNEAAERAKEIIVLQDGRIVDRKTNAK
jgi:putative ABC transport system ATP-binding protein